MDRIRASNTEDFIQSQMLNAALDQEDVNSRIFYFGTVINNQDPMNANRVQVRIPGVDEIYYISNDTPAGNTQLPWCSPINRNFISTPENNTIVMVAIFDPKVPFWGRMYFDCITSMSTTEIFDYTRLTPESNTYNNWGNAQLAYNVSINGAPNPQNLYGVGNNVIYPAGIRGKGANRITLDSTFTAIYQNEGTSSQSMLQFTDSILMHASKEIEIISDAGNSNHYHPVFDSPLYDFIEEQNSTIKAIITVMNSVPSLASSGIQNVASPDAVNLLTNITQLYLKFNQLKQPGQGASDQISIN